VDILNKELLLNYLMITMTMCELHLKYLKGLFLQKDST